MNSKRSESAKGLGPGFDHSALLPARTAPGSHLEEARLTDKQRLSVVLQGSALLAHLEHGRSHLRDSWEGAVVDTEGLLRSVQTASGPAHQMAQVYLLELISRLFRSEDSVDGRGEARRAARSLQEGWRQTLTPVAGDEAVRTVLDEADFLWGSAFGSARKTLLAEHGSGDNAHLWVVGPGRFRKALLSRSENRDQLEKLLTGSAAQEIWAMEEAGTDPRALAHLGQWRAAVAAWNRSPPEGLDDRLEFAHALLALGHFGRAQEAVRGMRRPGARILRVTCLVRLGKLGAARRLVKSLESSQLKVSQTLDLAEAAVRIYSHVGATEKVQHWVDRALTVAGKGSGPRAKILAALAAYDQKNLSAMRRHLDSCEEALNDSALAWKWNHARGLLADSEGDGPATVDFIARALSEDRRRLSPFEAGGLWNDLALGRARCGDLAGAEKAFLHTVNLFKATDSTRTTTLALCNLAEIRLRQGRMVGIRDIIQRTSAQNRASGNWRGIAGDAELRARYELVRGRPSAALETIREVLEELAKRKVDLYQDVLHVLAARALGWLERPEEAHAELEATTEVSRAELEGEEIPALWALAGDRERALQENDRGPLGKMWQSLLTAQEISSDSWEVLGGMSSFRSARFVFDVECVFHGVVPDAWLRRAVATFRRIGAGSMAEQLEERDMGPWLALGNYLRGSGRSAEHLRGLLTTAGYGDVFLRWSGDSRAEVIVDGAGGPEELSTPLHGGSLVLAATELDPVLKALFSIVARDLRPSGATAAPTTVERSKIIGQSPALLVALDRLSKLARRDITILIQGETGTGKELAAKQVHAESSRADGAFVPVNCAAFTDSLLSSDLFGHVRGAFTGAERDRAGIFETATGGTVFLDEIGDLPLPTQGNLLRVLQEGEVRRVGETLARRVDVRILTATHYDLADLVKQGRFRKDLYYRLNVGTVLLPPLRERGHDVLELADHFLAREDPSQQLQLEEGARTRLLEYQWPGNVRELKNIMDVAAALADGGRISADNLELPNSDIPSAKSLFHTQVNALRKTLIEAALNHCNRNQSEAARHLGISRQALSYLIRRFDL
ncbi:MAG: sigma 54-interacting transcriptional regulator [Thermoanaerobaculia bacterium]